MVAIPSSLFALSKQAQFLLFGISPPSLVSSLTEYYWHIATDMRSLRSKRIKNETTKYLSGPFDDSLIQIQLDKNEKCIQEISKGNFNRAAEFLRQIDSDGAMISLINPQRDLIRSLFLNTHAYYHQKQQQYEKALNCLEEAQKLQQNGSPIDCARTQLNKSVILSHLGKHAEAISLGRSALESLSKRKNQSGWELRKNQYKMYQIMIVSFYNIAAQLSHLSEQSEAHQVYREGYYLAQKTLGPQHKLTQLLRGILKQHRKDLSRSKQKLHTQPDSKSIHSFTLDQSFLNQEIIPQGEKEKQLRRIYASKRNSTSQVRGHSRKDMHYFLKSLEKIKNIYGNKRISTEGSEKTSIGKLKKLYTESGSNRYQEKVEHQRIKDIILNGKIQRLNSTANHSQILPPPAKEKEEVPIRHSSLPKTEPIPPISPCKQPDLTLQIIAEKAEKKQAEGSDCQLI